LRNEVLAVLRPEDLDWLRPQLQPVTLVAGQVLYEVNAPIEHVYFLEEGIVSLTADSGSKGLVEVGLSGREDLVGVQALLSADAIHVHRSVVQIPGRALRMRTAAFRDAADNLSALRDRCLRSIQVNLAEVSQTACCNARHGLPARLARWLLMVRDRVDSDELMLTQEFLSYMLGVRRAGVSVVASSLQGMGLIRQGRGRVVVLDRGGLKNQACICYQVIQEARQRIIGSAR
jgi:CRP-like cAMP-binding protein